MATVLSLPEQRLLLKGISWETYERLLAEHKESAGPRFTYDNGLLEIMVLSVEHEKPNRTLALLVEVLAEEFQIDLERVGSNTFKREDLRKGFEPDSAFYIQHAEAISGKKRIDLTQDPPPDLVIEIEVTSAALPRFPIFAAVGVPEVWYYDGNRVQIFTLEGERYTEIEHSVALPPLSSIVATRFLKASEEMKSTAWLRMVREWARTQSETGNTAD